jgi:hypothetical protein
LARAFVVLFAVIFIAGMAVLTVLDFANNGVTLVGVIGAGVVIVIGVGVGGALLQPPRK